MSMVPEEGSSRKFRQRSKVPLPEPLRPMMTTTSFWVTEKDTPFRTCRRSNHLCKFSTRMISLSLIGVPHTFFHISYRPGRDDGQDPIEESCDDEHLHKLTVHTGKTAGTEGHFPDAHDGDLGRILLHGNELVANIRDDHTDRLRQDYAAQDLHAIHTDRFSCLTLTTADGLNAGTEYFRHISAIVKTQSQDTRLKGAEDEHVTDLWITLLDQYRTNLG